MTVEMILQFNK